jgi:hypothetical protein
MVLYSDIEKIEMILIYDETGRNSVEAFRLYAEKYPERNHPSRQSFDHIVQLFCKTEIIKSPKRERLKSDTGEDVETFILAAINNLQVVEKLHVLRAFPNQVYTESYNVINFIRSTCPYIRSFMIMTLKIM